GCIGAWRPLGSTSPIPAGRIAIRTLSASSSGGWPSIHVLMRPPGSARGGAGSPGLSAPNCASGKLVGGAQCAKTTSSKRELEAYFGSSAASASAGKWAQRHLRRLGARTQRPTDVAETLRWWLVHSDLT